jgi:ATP-dependent Clp protease protease subunit
MPTQAPDSVRRRFYASTNPAKVGEIWIYDDIGPSFFSDGIAAKDVAAAIKQVQADGAKSLNLYLNSGGGSVFEGVAIHSIISRFMGLKTVYVDGIAASIASLIAMAGDKILISAGAMMMIHNPMGGQGGDGDEMRAAADRLDKIRDAMVDAYVQRTGRDADKIRSMMATETWMTAAECVTQGFADQVIARGSSDQGAPAQMRVAASALSPVLASYQNLPASLRSRLAAQHPHLSTQFASASARKQPLASALAATGKQPQHSARRQASGPKLPTEKTMSKKELARAAAHESMDILKSAHETATASLRESLANVQASNEDLREKIDGFRTETSTAQAQVKAKDDVITAMKAEMTEFLAVVGKANLAEARGVFAAYKQEAEDAKALRAQLAKTEEASKVSAFTALIDKGVSEGKITPAEAEKFKVTKPEAIATASAFLETVLLARDPIVKITPTEQKKPADSVAALNVPADIAELAKQMGWDPAKINAQIASGQTPPVS